MNKIASSATSRATAILAIITVAVMLAFAAVMTVSAQSNDPDWRQAPTGLSVTTGNEAGKLGHQLGYQLPRHQDAVRLPRHLEAG